MARAAVLTFFVLAAAALARADDVDPEPVAAGKEILGAWVYARSVGAGKGMEIPPSLKLTFEKGKVTVEQKWNEGGKETPKVHTYEVDGRKMPAHIRLINADRKEKDVEGIWKVEKGELYICIGERTGKRPTSFDGKDEPVLILKRQNK